jgi:hypothetical protein
MTVESALIRAGVDPEIAEVIARKHDPDVMPAVVYLGRFLDVVESALDAFEPACGVRRRDAA